MNITIPALLFPVVSLFFIAFTTRFLGLSAVVRQLLVRLEQERKDCNPLNGAGPSPEVIGGTMSQIRNLYERIKLIRFAQILALGTILSATISMGLIQNGMTGAGEAFFVLGLLFLITSVAGSVYEIYLSVGALEIELKEKRVLV